jgi:hypothetical protein
MNYFGIKLKYDSDRMEEDTTTTKIIMFKARKKLPNEQSFNF